MIQRLTVPALITLLLLGTFLLPQLELPVVHRSFAQPSGQKTVDNPTTDEMTIFKMVNEQRKANGLPELSFDRTAFQAARFHSNDMAKRGFFNHNSPEGGRCEDRLRQFKYVFENTTWGENIAANFNHSEPLRAAVEGWMNSPGHRQNILNNRFQYGAIGIAKDKNGKYYFTQVFWGRIR